MRDIAWFRRLLALHQLIYLAQFWPRPGVWFSAGQMVAPELLQPSYWSAAHALGPIGGSVFWLLAVAGWLLLALFPGWMPRWAQLGLFFAQLALHHANPLVIHEPQQLANFFLLVSLLWPREAAHPSIPRLRRAMVAMLAIYYLVAGLKKLPDPHWLSGDALGLLLRWPPLALEGGPTALGRLLLEHGWLARLGTWFALAFELGFAVVARTRYRRALIPAGIAFHLLIASTIEVGTFGWIMLPWYCFLWRRPS